MTLKARCKKVHIRNICYASIALLFLLTLSIVISILYESNKMINSYLTHGKGLKESIIYARSKTIHQGDVYDLGTTSELLRKRGFRASSVLDTYADSYHVHNGVIEIRSAPYMTAYGREKKERRIKYKPGVGVIAAIDGGPDSIQLKPYPYVNETQSSIRHQSYTPLITIPKDFIAGLLHIEDKRFYTHIGIDIYSILRAIIANVKSGSYKQGASTITQQLAKNLFFTRKKTLKRKVIETFTALLLEWKLDKNRILELYINEVYFGQHGVHAIHGAEKASLTFFGKSLVTLRIHEFATLIAIIQAPSYYSPWKQQGRLKKKRNQILKRLWQSKIITELEYAKSKHKKLLIQAPPRFDRKIPFFRKEIDKELDKILDRETGVEKMISVFTGIDESMQHCAEHVIENQIKRMRKHSSQLQGGLVAIEPHTGLIRAWVGGKDFSLSQFDHVSQSKRQIGSLVKPFIYLSALDKNLNNYKTATPVSMVSDEPLKVKLINGTYWEPKNFDNKFLGTISFREALEKSRNLPAVYISQQIGIHSIAKLLRSIQVARKIKEVPSIALGAIDTTLLRVTAAFGGLANQGVYVKPRLFKSVKNARGDIMYKSPLKQHRFADAGATFLLNNMLQGVINEGTAKNIRRMRFHGSAAGKTGTSNNGRDSWFVGYTPKLVAGVWVGYDDSKETQLTGGSAAAPIWTAFMKCIHPSEYEMEFVKPKNIVTRRLCVKTKELAHAGCSQTYDEYFVKGTEPNPIHSSGLAVGSQEIHSEFQNEFQKKKPRRKRNSFWEMIME